MSTLTRALRIAVAAVALGAAGFPAITDASARPIDRGFRGHGGPPVFGGRVSRHDGIGGFRGHPVRRGCWEAECGGGTIPYSNEYIVRGCQLTPPGADLPPWCQDLPGVPRVGIRGFRR